jgi:sodium transport system permease protein
MNTAHIGIVFRKELTDMIRDRRTLISMIVVPLLVMPALIFGLGLLTVKLVRQAKAEVPTVMLLGAADSPQVRAQLEGLDTIRWVPPAEDYVQRISARDLRAAIKVPDDFDAAVERGEVPEVRLLHFEGEIKSGFAVQALERFLRDQREAVLRARLEAQGLPPDFVRPFEFRRENVAPPEKVGGNLVGGFLPYVVIILCLTGAMYPAIDLTAGEKERGTMETILSSPVGRLELVLGKFLLILAVSLATVVFSLGAMGGSFLFGGMAFGRLAGAGDAGGASGGLPFVVDPVGLVSVFFLVLPVAVFFSALLFTLALFAKSYKEAQSYVSPLLIVAIVPAVSAMLPGFELTPTLALVPVLNVSLVCKELLGGVFNWTHLGLVFGSMSVYAAVALALAFAMFRREDVIFRS